jgi:hypothetical protein
MFNLGTHGQLLAISRCGHSTYTMIIFSIAHPDLDIVIVTRICDRNIAFWVEHSRRGMVFGEREPIFVCNPVAMPITKSVFRDARISRNLRDGSALQIGHTEVVDDIADIGVSVDVMLAFHDSPEGRDHRED